MSNEKILVVEDEMIVAEDIQMRLISMGYDVVGVAGSGKTALNLVDSKMPDLVLMDIKLKGKMDGIETAQIINDLYMIPVIFLTAHSDENTLQRAKLTSPMGYIVKPFEKSHAYSTIEIVLYRYRREKKLRESEQWLSSTIRSMENAMISVDLEGVVAYMNPAACLITGISGEQATGKQINDLFTLIDLKSREVKSGIVEAAISGTKGASNKGSAILKSVDGYETPVDYAISPIRKDSGPVTGAIMMFNDISERLKIEEALLRNETKYRGMVEMAGEGVLSLDQNHLITFVNQNMADMLGYPKDAITGTHIRQYIDPDSKSLLMNIIQNRAENNIVRCDIKLQCKDGKNKWAIFSINLLYDINKTYAGALIMVSDITQRKIAESDMEKSKERAELYFDLMRKDILNMNHAIMGFLEMADEKISKKGVIEEKDRFVIDRPVEVLKASTRLIDNIRDLDLDAEGMLPREITDLGKLLLEVKTRAVQEHRHNVNLNYRHTEGFKVMAGSMLTDLFRNIIESAIGHCYGEATIDIALDEIPQNGKKYYRVTITDSGCKLPPDAREKIEGRLNTPEYQVNSRGLGLHMSNMIVKSHDGELNIEKIDPNDNNEKTRFVVTLPACE